jgi:hypothetical protein
MTHQDINQLLAEYKDDTFRDQFLKAIEIREQYTGGILTENYQPSNVFSDSVSLTQYGKKYADFLKSIDDSLTDSEINFVLFIRFFHEELFIDVIETKFDVIIKVLNEDIISGKIRYPWIFDTLLYDKFLEVFGSGRETLSFEDVRKLLDGTPKGVFQYGDGLVGPFGLIKSEQKRWFPPRKKLPLWHCPDAGCTKLHTVKLLGYNGKISKLSKTLLSKLETDCPEPSNWDVFYYINSVNQNQRYYDEIQLRDIMIYLGNCFNENELKLILKRLIETYSKYIRPLFPSTGQFKDNFEGSSDQITNGLDKSKYLQLILILSDQRIVRTIESLIEENIIEIPATEIRTLKKHSSRFDTGSLSFGIECSRNGIRSISNSGPIALIRLKRLIREIYKSPPNLELLDWKLRHITGESRYEKLDMYLHSENPKKILSNLVLESPNNLKIAFDYLRYGKFDVPNNIEEENRIISKLLWKVGFDVNMYPDHINLFWSRYNRFAEIVSRCDGTNGEIQELLRSSAVNFFVSLEQILGYSLSFMTWTLLSDHIGTTHFKLNLKDAQEFMATTLNEGQKRLN